MGPGRLKLNPESFLNQCFEQVQTVFLGKRFAAGHQHQPMRIMCNPFQNGVDGECLASVCRNGLWCIAVVAAKRATGQTDEGAGSAGQGTFSLDTLINLMNTDGSGGYGGGVYFFGSALICLRRSRACSAALVSACC